ncbi:MAG: hypothetical protein WDW36_010025 [Sanguina aurantia]
MGRKLKRGKVGNVAQYITRNQAIRKLQLRLSEFRRLSILKGIHPREPKKKVHGANKTYYHVKDINWMMHEPLLNTFRNLKAYDRKVRKAKAKSNFSLAQRLQTLKPTYRLDHLIKERYPSFVDALRDLDDPLTMIHLFATLPAEKRYNIPVKAVETARRLAMEFQAYMVRAHALRRVFISVKGFYFQAELLGQSVTWLVPHQLSQVLPPDVDYRIMLTFLEYYTTMLQFVNFKLYHMLGLAYPPMLDPKLEEAAAGLAAIMKELAGMREQVSTEEDAKHALSISTLNASAPGSTEAPDTAGVAQKLKLLKQITGQADEDGDEDKEEDAVPQVDSGESWRVVGNADDGSDEGEDSEASDDDDAPAASKPPSGKASSTSSSSAADAYDADLQAGGGGADSDEEGAGDEGARAAGGALGISPDDEASVCGALFRGCVMYLGREVPQEHLLLVVRAFGGVAAWDGPGSPFPENSQAITHQVVDRPTQGHRFLSRSYVQPQWVIDSANFRVLMPVSLYAPGLVPPQHLSPFVDNEDEGYTPEFANTVKKLQEAAKAARRRASDLAAGKFVDDAGEDGADDAGGVALTTGRSEEEVAQEAERTYLRDLAKELRASGDSAAAASVATEDEESEEGEGSEDDEMEDDESEGKKKKASKKAAAAAAGGKKRSAAELEEADTASMKDIMMTRKNRKFYERIQTAQKGKRDRVAVLEEKAAAAVAAVAAKEKPVPKASGKAAKVAKQ